MGIAAPTDYQSLSQEMIASKATGFQNDPVDFQPARNSRFQYLISSIGGPKYVEYPKFGRIGDKERRET